jgi:hypothetical protein
VTKTGGLEPDASIRSEFVQEHKQSKEEMLEQIDNARRKSVQMSKALQRSLLKMVIALTHTPSLNAALQLETEYFFNFHSFSLRGPGRVY